jgi:hypothetical protein
MVRIGAAADFPRTIVKAVPNKIDKTIFFILLLHVKTARSGFSSSFYLPKKKLTEP